MRRRVRRWAIATVTLAVTLLPAGAVGMTLYIPQDRSRILTFEQFESLPKIQPAQSYQLEPHRGLVELVAWPDRPVLFAVEYHHEVNLWSLLVYHWPELLALAMLAAWLVCLGRIWKRRKRRHLVGQPCCRQCGYCLTGSEAPSCPECGAALTGKTRVVAKPISRALVVAVSAPPMLVLALAWADGWCLGRLYTPKDDSILPRVSTVNGWFCWTSLTAYQIASPKLGSHGPSAAMILSEDDPYRLVTFYTLRRGGDQGWLDLEVEQLEGSWGDAKPIETRLYWLGGHLFWARGGMPEFGPLQRLQLHRLDPDLGVMPATASFDREDLADMDRLPAMLSEDGRWLFTVCNSGLDAWALDAGGPPIRLTGRDLDSDPRPHRPGFSVTLRGKRVFASEWVGSGDGDRYRMATWSDDQRRWAVLNDAETDAVLSEEDGQDLFPDDAWTRGADPEQAGHEGLPTLVEVGPQSFEPLWWADSIGGRFAFARIRSGRQILVWDASARRCVARLDGSATPAGGFYEMEIFDEARRIVLHGPGFPVPDIVLVFDMSSLDGGESHPSQVSTP